MRPISALAIACAISLASARTFTNPAECDSLANGPIRNACRIVTGHGRPYTEPSPDAARGGSDAASPIPMDTTITVTVRGTDTTRTVTVAPRRDWEQVKSDLHIWIWFNIIVASAAIALTTIAVVVAAAG